VFDEFLLLSWTSNQMNLFTVDFTVDFTVSTSTVTPKGERTRQLSNTRNQSPLWVIPFEMGQSEETFPGNHLQFA